jgi:hypothetical protein
MDNSLDFCFENLVFMTKTDHLVAERNHSLTQYRILSLQTLLFTDGYSNNSLSIFMFVFFDLMVDFDSIFHRVYTNRLNQLLCSGKFLNNFLKLLPFPLRIPLQQPILLPQPLHLPFGVPIFCFVFDHRLDHLFPLCG